MQFSRIAFETWQLGGNCRRFDDDAAVKAIRRVRDLDANFFDPAQAIDEIVTTAVPVNGTSPESV